MAKILITNKFIKNYSGSEINVLEIAKELMKTHEVTVATFEYDSPMKELFEKYGIKVVNVLEDTMDGENYDLIWCQHSSVLYKCLFDNDVSAGKIIFSSLSSYDFNEAPPAFYDDINLCLANSMETREKLMYEGVKEWEIYVFKNSADRGFFESYIENKSDRLKKICVITNHIAHEILVAKQYFEYIGIDVDVYGFGYKTVRIDGNILNEYDAVITIGKTVQYAMAAGVPVYCYDRFGGRGWVSMDNIKDMEYYNFSGRDCNRKIDGKAIFLEIINGFSSAFASRNEIREYAGNNYSLEKNIRAVLELLEKQNNVDIGKIKKHYRCLQRPNNWNLELAKTVKLLREQIKFLCKAQQV